MRQPASHPRLIEHARLLRRSVRGLRGVAVVGLIVCASGCGLFGSSQQVKQLQTENDRLLSEYRAQRQRVASLQETNAALEARVGEAERLLAQVGKTLPSSRISRAPQRSTPSGSSSAISPSTGSPSTGSSSAISPSTGAGLQTPPKYIPPSVPSLPEAGSLGASDDDVQWRPMRRQ